MTELQPSRIIRQQAISWLTRRHSGAFSAEDYKHFEYWLNSNPQHRQIYEQIELVWQNLPRPEAELSNARRQKNNLPTRWLSAAVLLLTIGAAAYEGWPLSDDSVFRTAKGELRHITLADGSQVELNSDSELVVHYAWQRRALELVRGEALFSVAPGKLRSFQVTAGGGILKDIGTRFDVLLNTNGNRVSVLEGAIDLRLALERRQTLAGQSMTYNAHHVLSEPSATDIEAITAWREHKLVFRNQPLSEVIAELQRYHSATIRLIDPSLSQLRLGGVFDNGDLQGFLITLAAVLPVEIKYGKNGEILIDRRRS